MPEIVCTKCGAKIPPNLNPDRPRSCMWCDEPCEELRELDKATWAEGDFEKQDTGV